jgi:uncharacterized membrane protein YjfL (UPF0719 family)
VASFAEYAWQSGEKDMGGVWLAYLITFGWAIVGSVSMGVGIVITLKIMDWSTKNVDEWDLIKKGNIPIAIIFGCAILATGYVIAHCIQP